MSTFWGTKLVNGVEWGGNNVWALCHMWNLHALWTLCAVWTMCTNHYCTVKPLSGLSEKRTTFVQQTIPMPPINSYIWNLWVADTTLLRTIVKPLAPEGSESAIYVSQPIFLPVTEQYHRVLVLVLSLCQLMLIQHLLSRCPCAVSNTSHPLCLSLRGVVSRTPQG